MNFKKSAHHLIFHSALLPVVFLLALIALFLQVYLHSSVKPAIESIEPAAALPGALLTISGSHFGNFDRDSEVIIAGIRPTRSAYKSWSENQIILIIPEDVGSGRVFVKNDKGASNGLLFTNKSHIPLVLEGPVEPGVPYIDSISPETGPVGTEITIRGMNFGFERQEGEVLFQFFSGAENEKREEERTDTTIACSSIDFDYLSWNDQELRVRVPDGASPGGVVVTTDRGESNSIYFEVTNPVGTKRYPRMKGYQVAYGVEISQVRSSGQASMEIWVPAISKSCAQRGIEGIHEPEPLWRDYRGVMRYHLSDFDPWTTYRLEQTYWFDRYSIETDIHERSVATYDRESSLFRRYTASNVIIPADDEFFTAAASRQARRAASPWAAARALYDYLLEKLTYSRAPAKNVRDAVEQGRGDSYDYAMAYVTLCRAAGIPARPVAGFIVYGDKKSRRHYWAEFYLEKFGWVPVDPALGDGMQSGEVVLIDNPRDYYFGNLDNQHIDLSRGIIELRPADPQARVVRYERNYSLQSIHEEYSRSIESYRAVWKDMEVVGWW
ncbi:transglutaminase domain-containing protein [Sediminispirochaeta smaragdinae]|uniref:Transglutaminase domain protein n=1 Tax=Sediminispirochaeta smaragdinae (strain DSM 11293 / JCM 15392 / SEBR 4228) TaxID=573413 RepID=E1R384_SEDSS|nr:transglutaminase domain-containing protein [Sediminispirochaeta smaragdinae]ADK81270.1 transglutaminase domain protein [Sediminispirochaeta smaragdinae DSM 11293]